MTTGRDEATGEPVVEVTHEALIRGWPELRGWIDEDRDRLRAERRLSDAAAEWDARRPRRGRPLPRRPPRGLGGARHSRTSTRWSGTSSTRAAARAERERAARRRRVRIAIGALSVAVAVIVAAIAVFALIQRNDANDQRDVATSRAARRQLDRWPASATRSSRRCWPRARTRRRPPSRPRRACARASTTPRSARRSGRRTSSPSPPLPTPRGPARGRDGRSGDLQLWDPAEGPARRLARARRHVAGGHQRGPRPRRPPGFVTGDEDGAHGAVAGPRRPGGARAHRLAAGKGRVPPCARHAGRRQVIAATTAARAGRPGRPPDPARRRRLPATRCADPAPGAATSPSDR